MAQEFTLRLITRQAGGGEIVRTRKVEFQDVLIGRGAENDIVLDDLSVDLNHAKITRASPGRVTVEAEGAGGFTLDGREATRAQLDVAGEPRLGFGGYDLVLEPGEDGEVVITVTQREEPHAESVSLFSLKAQIFGRRRMAWIYGLIVFAMCLIVPAAGALFMDHMTIHPDKQWSSGPLSKSHAFLEDDCQACHQKAFVAVRDETCLSCHQTNLDQAATARLATRLKDEGSPNAALAVKEHATHDELLKGAPPPSFPGGMIKAGFQWAFNHPATRCASCHLEHTAPIPEEGTPEGRVKRAATPELAEPFTCGECHDGLKKRLPATDLLDTPDWGRHPGFRPLVTVSAKGEKADVRRIAVSAHPREDSGVIFPHRLHLDPLGGPARQAMQLGADRGYGGTLVCASCHRPDKTGTGFRPIEMERDCSSCHSLAFAGSGANLKFLPHGQVDKVVAGLEAYYAGGGSPSAGSGRRQPGEFAGLSTVQGPRSSAAAAALRTAFAPAGICSDCHTIQRTGGWPGVRVEAVKLTDRFLPRGGFDHSIGAHRGQGAGAFACADCHKAATSDTAQDFLIPDVAKCASCHGKTKAQTPAAASADCSTCHSFHRPSGPALTAQDKLMEAIRGSWETAPAVRQ